MAIAKKDIFASNEVELAEWAKAFGHPARLAIIKVLAERNSCVCGEIVDEVPLAQATVSQHLKALKVAEIVDGTVDGPRSCYCLNQKTLKKAQAAFGAFFDKIIQPECC